MSIFTFLFICIVIGSLAYIRSKCKYCNKMTKDNPKNVKYTNTAIGFDSLQEDLLRTQKEELQEILSNKKEKKIMFSTKWFSLVKDGHYFYIDYGKESSGIVILPIVNNSHVVFVKNYRYPLKQDSWELPRGFIDNKETFFEAGLRELLEETAYNGSHQRCSILGFIAPDTSLINNKIPIVQVHLSSEDLTNNILDTEISATKHVAIIELDQWLNDNNVIDGITLSALFKGNLR